MNSHMVAMHIATPIMAFTTLGFALSLGDPPATPLPCELVDLAVAIQVIGPDAQMIGEDSDPDSCMYMTSRAVLTIELLPAEFYDQTPLGEPHTAVDIGDRARHATHDAPGASVQFVKGDYSVIIGASNIAGGTTSFLDPLLAAAQVAAERLP